MPLAEADERNLIADVRFDDRRMYVLLQDGREISVPLWWYPLLLRATPEQRNNWEHSAVRRRARTGPTSTRISTSRAYLSAPKPRAPHPRSRRERPIGHLPPRAIQLTVDTGLRYGLPPRGLAGSGMAAQQHQFGGTWTDDKLDRLSRYLCAYMTALKSQPFRRAYIDAFAGTGYRATKQPGETVRGFFPLDPLKELAKGSARRALEVEPAFDRYYFIEANAGRFRELVKLRDAFPALQNRMIFRNNEANSAIASLCQTEDWRCMRAVMFLDPYGMQVEWTTIELIASARHIDLWYLFPVGIVQRLLRRRGNINPQWEAALDRVLGDHEWRDRFYARSGFFPLFPEDDNEVTKIATVDTIQRYVRDRLDNLFQGGVAQRTLQLRNSKNSCMFLLFFACGNPNPKAHQLAMRIAENILSN